jgi:hypothetical protein
MAGFKVDPDAIEYCIKEVLDPAIARFDTTWVQLTEASGSPDSLLLGESRLPGSTAFNDHCRDVLHQLERPHWTVCDNQKAVTAALREFRDILQETLNAYRHTELRNEESLRAAQPPQ